MDDEGGGLQGASLLKTFLHPINILVILNPTNNHSLTLL